MSSEFLYKDTIYVNSKKRISGRSDNFVINLLSQIKINNEYDTATLLNFSCPKSYYLFNNSNNTFQLTESKTTTTILIPVGNYTAASLVITLTSSINAVSTFTYSISLNQQLGKLTFSVTGNLGEQPIFDFTSSKGCEEILGFENDAYIFSGNNLISVSIVNLQLTNTIQLLTNLVENNILSTIIPNSPDFSTILYNESNPAFASQKLSLKNVQSANFWLLDGNSGLPLDLNGLEFNFTFSVYKSNTYYEKILFDKIISNYIEEAKN